MSDFSNITHVGIAEMDIVSTPQTIRTSGLGSCVAVIIYDRRKEMAGLAHVMLPDSSMSKKHKYNTGKYADTAVEELIKRLLCSGAHLQKLQAKIAGGAQMFHFSDRADLLRIGQKNVEAVRNHLSRYKIPIVAEDVGGNSGRSVEFDPKTATLTIRTVNKGIKKL